VPTEEKNESLVNLVDWFLAGGRKKSPQMGASGGGKTNPGI
jgi:hypothetical protein